MNKANINDECKKWLEEYEEALSGELLPRMPRLLAYGKVLIVKLEEMTREEK